MASETDSSSTDTTSFGLQTAYALYRYNDKCEPKETEYIPGTPTHNDFTLSLVISSFDTVQETELRLYLCKRLPKCYSTGRNSHIGSVDISITEETEGSGVLCYYNLFERKVASDPLALDTEDFSSHYVVCLLASGDVLLDLFRPELDAFTEELVSRLDAGDPVSVEERACSSLEGWYHHCTQYLYQCVHRLGMQVKYLLYAALVDIPVTVHSSDNAFEGLVQRFVKCCSVSELLQQTATNESNKPDSDSDTGAVLVSIPSSSRQNPPLDVLQLRQENLQWTVSSDICSRFCEEWAEALVEGQADKTVIYLRQVIDNYKLKAIHDLNRLKRLLKEAQTNYYSLYRCLVFLRQCGNAVVLLRQARHEDSLCDDSESVLGILQESLNTPLVPAS